MVQVVDQSNAVEFANTGKVADFDPDKKPEPVKAEEPKVEAAPAADDTDLTDDEKAAKAVMGSKKWDQVIGRRHRAQKEAEEARREADSFAENQYRERIAAEKRADELEARLKALESKAQPEKVSDTAPDPKDFKEPSEYWEAKIKYEAAKAVEADRAVRAEETRKSEAARLDAARIERNKAFAKTHADYDDVMADLAEHDLMVPGYITEYLMESESSAAVMYHFAKHPDVFAGIAKLSPIKAIAAIGKLEAQLEKAEVKAEEPLPGEKPDVSRSRAPAPITPVGTDGGNGSAHKELKDMNTQETIAYWEARDKASARRRQRH